MANKDFKVKNKLQVAGITSEGPVVSDAFGNLDSTSSIATQFGGTGTTTSPDSGQILYSASGTNYAPATLAGLPGTYAVGNTASRPGSPSLGQIYSNTQTGYIEVYTNEGWSQLGVIPLSATIGTATDVGTSREYNNGAASITFTPASGGGLASSFTASSTSGGYSASGSSSPIVVTNIPVGTTATFTVTATNGYGNALASTASNSITATTVPQAPTIGTATATTGIAYGSTPTASLAFTAGATGGKTISNYKYSTDNITYTALSPEDATSPVTIPGLTAGTSYTFRLKAVNANGDSVATSASNSITAATVPQVPTIGTVTRTSDTIVSVPFTDGATGGSAITSYTIISSPSIALTYSGTTSPMAVTGSFATNTSYTFTIVANNAYGASTTSSESNSIIPYPAYALAQTFTSTGTYTIPSGKNQIAVFIKGGGTSGNSGLNQSDGQRTSGGGSGGGGAGLGVIYDYAVNAGTTYNVVIGSASGSSNFGGMITANGASGQTAGNYSSNLATYYGATGGSGGGGGGVLNPKTYSNGKGSDGSPGGAGSSGTAYSVNLAGLGSVSYRSGSGGGGGGGGANSFPNDPILNHNGGSGGAGGTSAGNGGSGGGSYGYSSRDPGGAGNTGTGFGNGGGGGGGSGGYGGGSASPGSAGSGNGGVAYIYVK